VLQWVDVLLGAQQPEPAVDFLLQQALCLAKVSGVHTPRLTLPLLQRALQVCRFCVDHDSTREVQVRREIGTLLEQQGRQLSVLDVLDDLASDESATLRAAVGCSIKAQLSTIKLDVFAQLQRLGEGMAEVQSQLSIDLSSDTSQRVSSRAINRAAEVFVLALSLLDMGFSRLVQSQSLKPPEEVYFPVTGSRAALDKKLAAAGLGVGPFEVELKPALIKALVMAALVKRKANVLTRTAVPASCGCLSILPVALEVPQK